MADFNCIVKQRGKGVALLIFGIVILIMGLVFLYMLVSILSSGSNIKFEYGALGALLWACSIIFMLGSGLYFPYAGFLGIKYPVIEFSLKGEMFHAFQSMSSLTYNGSKPIIFDLSSCEWKYKESNGNYSYILKNSQGKCTVSDKILTEYFDVLGNLIIEKRDKVISNKKD